MLDGRRRAPSASRSRPSSAVRRQRASTPRRAVPGRDARGVPGRRRRPARAPSAARSGTPAPVRPEQGPARAARRARVFANLRPVRRWTTRTSSPLRPELAEGIDLVIVRELTGGLYFGDRRSWTTTAASTPASTRADEVERIARRALRAGPPPPREAVLASTRPNVLVVVAALARASSTEVAADYPDVELEHQLVDSMAMKLVEQPAAYDVIVTENMFGDILVRPRRVGRRRHRPRAVVVARRRPARACTRPIHGSAPDIAGTGARQPGRHHPVRRDDAARPRRDRRRGRRRARRPPSSTRARSPRTSAASATTEEFGAAVARAVARPLRTR